MSWKWIVSETKNNYKVYHLLIEGFMSCAVVGLGGSTSHKNNEISRLIAKRINGQTTVNIQPYSGVFGSLGLAKHR